MLSSPDKLRILISAYACEPGRGSEPGVGWNVVRELSSRVSLRVITRANNRKPILESGEPWVADVQWIFWDPPKWLTFWKKGGRGVQFFYILWQIGVYRIARKIVRNAEIDLCHHVTFGRCWIPSRLAALPVPFVFGPVGGGETTPPGLRGGLDTMGTLSEVVKAVVSWTYPRLPWNKNLYRRAAWTFAATAQTEQVLKNLGVTQLSILPQSGIRLSDLPQIENGSSPNYRCNSELRLVTAARLIHWKAIDLAIEAVAATAKDIPVRLIILQSGPEMPNLKTLTRRLGIENQVEFKGRLPSLEDVYREIACADALIHPALHEAFGQSCLESLALGVPVICLDWAGPGLIVDSTCGFAVPPAGRAETIEGLANAIRRLREEKLQGDSRADACRARAFTGFGWRTVGQSILECYGRILKKDQ